MALAQTLEQFLRKRGTYTSGPAESITAYRLLREGVRRMSEHIWKRPLYSVVAGAALMTACAASPQSQQPEINPVGPVGGGGASVLAPFFGVWKRPHGCVAAGLCWARRSGRPER